jgi:hypothetical protein
MRKHPNARAERYRFRVAGDAWAVGTNNGCFKVPSPEGPFDMTIIVSCGGGWDHVSVSLRNRTPTWKEMCAAKELFFEDEEPAMQLHPAKSDYVNYHLFCLHIWRPQTAEQRAALANEIGDDGADWPMPGPIPLPPSIFVAPKLETAGARMMLGSPG